MLMRVYVISLYTKRLDTYQNPEMFVISEFDINEIISTAKPCNNDVIDDWYAIGKYRYEIGTNSHF